MEMTIFRDNEPIILIDRHIGDDYMYGPGIMGGDFVRALNFIENSGYTKCEVWINSIGGSVMDGMEIYNAIINSTIEVNTRITGIAASTAGWISQAGKKRIMNSYSLLMMHPPSGGDEEGSKKISESIAKMLSSKCDKSEEEILKMMESETWMNAEECMNSGMCDEISLTIEIEKENKYFEDTKNKSAFALYNKAKLILNKIIEEKPKIEKMLKVKNTLGLDAEASEEMIVKEITNLRSEKEALEAKLKEIQDTLNKIEADKLEKENELKAKDLIALAEKEGKIESKEELKNNLIALAKKDYEGTKTLINSMPVRSVANRLPIEQPTTGGEDRNAWTYDDWQKKDAKGLGEIYKNDIERYNTLLKTLK